MRSGGLFAGYGGLDMALAEVFGAKPAWFSEIDDAPSKILAHHWPTVPNLGDITQIDWDQVEPVDILGGGFPCQDVSAAGKRAGIRPGNRSGLWNHFAYAISKLRPRYVVVENVRGLLSAEAHSDVEPCPWCLGDEPGVPALRALGAVLGDLANLGYDARWVGLPASEVGAPHGRFREFILAEDADLAAGREWRIAAPGQAEGGRARSDAGRRDRALAANADLPGSQGSQSAAGRDLPAGGTAAHADDDAAWNGRLAGGEAWSGTESAQCSATSPDAESNGWHEGWPEPARLLGRPDVAERCASATTWGQYSGAIRRWERVLGRTAPAPTEATSKGAQRLSPRFVEWMMGLPAGHVTAVPGVNRNAQLKALGNGVVPQQAIAALRHMHNQLTLTHGGN